MSRAAARYPRLPASTRRISRPLSIAGTVVLLVLLGVAAFVFAARRGYLTPSESDLRTRYAVAGSKFVTIAGEPVHYVDEGQGEPVVLLHGSFASLRQWDEWASVLRTRYRVIRYDRAPMGLSGTNASLGDDVGRSMRELAELMRTLGVARFHLVATSSAGLLGAAYAAEHPEQVRSLVLSNIAVGRFQMDTSHLPWLMRRLQTIEPWFAGWHSSLFWGEVLRLNFHDPSRVPAALGREWADLNNRTQRMPKVPVSTGTTSSPFERTVGDLPRILAPALVLWSEDDHEVPLATMGRRTLELLGSADKQLRTVAQCGHMMPLECGAASARIAQEFLDRVTSTAQPPPAAAAPSAKAAPSATAAP